MTKVLFIIFTLFFNLQSWAADMNVSLASERKVIEKVVTEIPSSVTLVKPFTKENAAMIPLIAALNIVHISFIQIPKIFGKNVLNFAIKTRSNLLVSFLVPLVLSKDEIAKIELNLKDSQDV